MQIITSWLKINRAFGAMVGLTALSCALLALGKAPLKSTASKIMAPSLPKIALVTADNASWVSEVQSKLVATGRFSQVDTIDAGTTTPTLAQLLAYKSVLVWSDSSFGDSTALGNNLADYVDGGGGVVIAVFTDASVPLSGRFVSDDYYVLEPNSQGSGQLTLGTVYEPSSPLMAGVTSFDGGTSSFRDGNPILNANAVRVADWSDGEPLIARRTINGNRRVDLNFFPPSTDSRNDFWVSSTDGVKIMANALEYVGLATCAPAPAGMVSWWKAEGNANDSQGGNNGMIGGATFVSGEVGQAFSFDGVDDYVDAGNSASINLTGSQVTIDAWINPSADLTTESWFFGKSGDGTVRYAIEWEPGDPCVLVGRANTGAVQANFTPPTNTWTHVAVVYDGNAETSTTKLYVNGVVVASGSPSSGNLTPTSAPFVIGAFDSTHTRNFKGLVDEVEVFDRALSDTEVARIFNAGSLGKCPCTPAPDSMISWWPGDGNGDDIVSQNNLSLGPATFGAGEVRQAFSFNGSGFADAGRPSNLINIGGQVTLDGWINPSDTNEANYFGKSQSGGNDYTLLCIFGPTCQLVAIIKTGGTEHEINTGYFPPVNAWTHVALTYDGDTMTVYANGANVGSTSFSGTIDDSGESFTIGGRSGGLFFTGLIDEVEVFDRGLSADEITAIYTAGGAGKCRACTPAPGGMAGWWPGNGNTADVIGHNDGTLQNGATFGAGEVDQGFSLDGNDDSVGVNQTPPTNSEITLDAWINPSTLNLDQVTGPVVFEKGTALFNRIGMQIKKDGSLCGYLNSDVLNVCSSPGVIQANQFTHVALTLSNNGESRVMTLYSNGQLVGQINGSDTLNAGTAGLVIGDSQTSGFYDNFAGIIDEVEMFGRALSQAEIQKIYDAGSAGKCPCTPPPSTTETGGMVSWWPGDDNANDIQDGNNGTAI